MIKNKNYLVEMLCYLTIPILLFAILYYKTMISQIGLPINYSGDTLFSSVIIKTIIETGWYFHNPYLGAPGIANLIEIPMVETTNILLIKFLSLFTKDVTVILNSFYYCTFLLISFTSYYVFRRLRLNRFLALAACVLYAFLPYHLLRNVAHLFLSNYFAVPIYILFCMRLFSSSGTKPASGKKYLLYFIVLAIAVSSGVYYAFFACCLLLFAGAVSAAEHATFKPFSKACALVLMIASIVALNSLPLYLHDKSQGQNNEMLLRLPREGELYGLKITQLLLPSSQHNIQSLRLITQKYDDSAPLVNENSTATLGVLGSLGFLILLWVLVYRRHALPLNTTLFNLSRLNFAAILLGTIGGFGSLISYLIIDMIRGYNRISVFIAFFSLFALFYAVQLVLEKYYPHMKNSFYLLLAASLLIVGFYDETGKLINRDDNLAMANQYSSDQQFVAKIESRLPPESMIFELPFAKFPEGGRVSGIDAYDLSRGYLHSHRLHWSFGALYGDDNSLWQRDVANLPITSMIAKLEHAGFAGIYINRLGYADNAVSLQNVLTELLKQQPMESPDKTLLFYSLL